MSIDNLVMTIARERKRGRARATAGSGQVATLTARTAAAIVKPASRNRFGVLHPLCR